MTVSVLSSASELNLDPDDVVKIIQALSMRDFYKSMTSYADHRIWQDVYHPVYSSLRLYLKITRDKQGYLLIALKEK